MKVIWCWRCKMDIPMVDEQEFALMHAKYMATKPDGRLAMLAEYERITGFRETHFNAIWHHRICHYGPPCPRCGKVLRTPRAYKCFVCGLERTFISTFLFAVTDSFAVKGRGTVVVADAAFVVGKAEVGDSLEFRAGGKTVLRTGIVAIERMHGPPNVQAVGIMLDPWVQREAIQTGQEVFLMSATG